MPLILSLICSPDIPLEVDAIRLDLLRGQTVDAVKQTLIQQGNRRVPLGDFFAVSGSAADDNELVWRGDCSRVKMIGHGHTSGKLCVDGDAGMHLGAKMSGGEIVVTGSADDWLGAEMNGGQIRVHGNVGHWAGAVYRGGRRGMRGGEILIDGDAGDFVGHTMRRGTIVVGGDAGDALGISMIAGTILVFGQSGIRHGAGMRRGTIGLFGEKTSPNLLPTFQYACRFRPLFLSLYLQHLRSQNFSFPQDIGDAELLRYCGDFLEHGRGEIFMRA